MKLVMGVVAAFVAALAAGPATAGDARCLWEHFPQAHRAEVLNHELAGIGEAMAASFTPDEAAASFTACGVAERTRPEANAALNAYALRLKAEKELLANADLAPDRLDAAWNALGEDVRGPLVRHAEDASAPDTAFDAVQLFADRLGLRGEVPGEVAVPLTAYLLTRAALTVYEQRF